MVYVFLADGFEDVEAVGTIDFLRRADIDVTTIAVTGISAKSSHGIRMEADVLSERMALNDELQGIVLPGGLAGTQNLGASEVVRNAIRYAFDNNRIIAAICAAPSILGEMGILEGKTATCYPGFESKLSGATVVCDNVVVCDNIITGKAAGVTWEFAAAVTESIKGPEAAVFVLESIKWTKPLT